MAKSPFRYQVCESDCFPTSVLNGLSHLFERRCIPGAVVQRVFLYTMDGVSRGHLTGDGTTDAAAQLLADWLGDYRTPRFRVRADLWKRDDVCLRPNSRLGRALARGAVAVCHVKDRGRDWHSLLVLGIRDGWVECWDPYKRSTLRDMGGRAEVRSSDGDAPNLLIKASWIEGRPTRYLRLGPVRERSALVLRRA